MEFGRRISGVGYQISAIRYQEAVSGDQEAGMGRGDWGCAKLTLNAHPSKPKGRHPANSPAACNSLSWYEDRTLASAGSTGRKCKLLKRNKRAHTQNRRMGQPKSSKIFETRPPAI
jgi:hypothetical protein